MTDRTNTAGALARENIDRLLGTALALADEVRGRIQYIRRTGFEVKRKPDGSYVTSADVEIERLLRERIAERFPDHGVIGEEAEAHNDDAEFLWILDPIDGTEDFVHGSPLFGCIIGLHYRGRPIVGIIDHPALDERVWAGAGTGAHYNGQPIKLADLSAGEINGRERLMLAARANFLFTGDDSRYFETAARAHPNHRVYRTCFAHTLVVTGRADAMLEYGNHIWDLAATPLLIEEAGGKYITVQDARSEDGDRLYGAVFGKPALVDRLRAIFSV